MNIVAVTLHSQGIQSG